MGPDALPRSLAGLGEQQKQGEQGGTEATFWESQRREQRRGPAPGSLGVLRSRSWPPPRGRSPGLLSHFPLSYLLFLVGFSGSPWPPTLPSPGAGFFRERRSAIGEGWRKLPLLCQSTSESAREMEAEPC